jgi:hypothetical protein
VARLHLDLEQGGSARRAPAIAGAPAFSVAALGRQPEPRYITFMARMVSLPLLMLLALASPACRQAPSICPKSIHWKLF